MLQKIKSLSARLLKSLQSVKDSQTKSVIAFLLVCATVLGATVLSTHRVNVFDGEKTHSVLSLSRNPLAVVNKLTLPEDYEIKEVSSDFFTTNLEIVYPFSLEVTLGSETVSYDVAEGSLADLLKSIGIELDEHDTVSLPLDTYIDGDTAITIEDVEYATETIEEEIPFTSTVEYSDKYDKSTTKVVAEGKTGTKVVTRSVKYVNGEAVSSEIVYEAVVEDAVDKKTVIGTKVPKMAASSGVSADKVDSVSTLAAPKDLVLDKNGVPVNYSSKKVLKATAYTHTGNKCSTGVYPQPGYIAVDPSEIPYGTEMYIVSADGKYVYGYAIAADTGGFTRGSVDLDLFFDTNSECVNFGVRNVNVYFVD